MHPLPGPLLSLLHILAHVIFPSTLGGSFYCKPYITDEKPERTRDLSHHHATKRHLLPHLTVMHLGPLPRWDCGAGEVWVACGLWPPPRRAWSRKWGVGLHPGSTADLVALGKFLALFVSLVPCTMNEGR